MSPVKLTADLIESFGGTFISPKYDQLCPTPEFHRAAWALYASDAPAAEVVAPRDHAKSSALTMVYILAEVLFRVSDYVILVSSTEDGAAEQLGNISEELLENDDLIREFGVKKFLRTSTTDVICEMNDGHRFRILARGAEQRIRGRLWKGKRPNLLVCDDMEDDEQVENADRRRKFRIWFFRAAKQALSKSGRIRVHGTILHDDSLLSRLRRNKTWKHLFYAAHQSFDDFSGILWPERWSEAQLRARRQEFIEDGDSAGYSQEFLNNPLDHSDAFLRQADFRPMTEDDYDSEKIVCAAADFAVSRADKANRTSFTVGGKDVNNLLHFIDQRVDRWDPTDWIDEMFSIQQRWNPAVFWVEDGVIWKSVRSMIYREMQIRDIRINFEAILPVKDKGTRGRSYQRRMRAGQCRFDKKAEWYPGFEQENLRFTGTAAATLDDQFDSAALLSRGFDDFSHVESEDFFSDEDWEMERGFWNRPKGAVDGRSQVTGY
jgi:predicted phage terminase large subunit-like protein